jgi:putative transposase
VIQQCYECGVSTRRVDQLVESLRLRVSKSEVSRIRRALDEHVDAFRTRPLGGAYPCVFLDGSLAVWSACSSPSVTRTPG